MQPPPGYMLPVGTQRFVRRPAIDPAINNKNNLSFAMKSHHRMIFAVNQSVIILHRKQHAVMHLKELCGMASVAAVVWHAGTEVVRQDRSTGCRDATGELHADVVARLDPQEPVKLGVISLLVTTVRVVW